MCKGFFVYCLRCLVLPWYSMFSQTKSFCTDRCVSQCLRVIAWNFFLIFMALVVRRLYSSQPNAEIDVLLSKS